MANVATSLRTFLLQDSSVSDIIGERIHRNRIPDEPTLPFVRMATITDRPEYHQQGMGPAKALIQLDMFAESAPAVDSLFDAIRAKCDGFRGVLGEYNARIFVTNETDSWSDNMRLFHRMLEVEVGHV